MELKGGREGAPLSRLGELVLKGEREGGSPIVQAWGTGSEGREGENPIVQATGPEGREGGREPHCLGLGNWS